ncbi:MAG TPA: phosphatidylglycerophosphatase A [Bacilli bacterium]|nr:phosphatidylglycerophosphatase A [Bacilli bacterium]
MKKINEDQNRFNDGKKFDVIVDRLEKRGVTLLDIAKVTYDLQKKYVESLTMETCLDHIERVIMKREVQHAILTGIELDRLAEEGLISEPLSTILLSDYGLYGIDEILALSIVNVYGSIGLTNFGFVDKTKPGIIGVLDNKKGESKNKCNTFIDDIVGAIAAAAASSIAHRYAETDEIIELYKK